MTGSLGLGLDGSLRSPATIAHFMKDIAQDTPVTYFNIQGVLFLGARMDEGSEFGAVDFLELKGRPIVVCRQSEDAWVWTRGAWQKETAIAQNCYNDGDILDRDQFVHRHPYAALELLELHIDC